MIYSSSSTNEPSEITLSANYPLAQGTNIASVPLRVCIQDRRTNSYRETPIGLFSSSEGADPTVTPSLPLEEITANHRRVPPGNQASGGNPVAPFEQMRSQVNRAHSHAVTYDYPLEYAQSVEQEQNQLDSDVLRTGLYEASHTAPPGSLASPSNLVGGLGDTPAASSFFRADGSHRQIHSPRFAYTPTDLDEGQDLDDEPNEGHRHPTLIRTSTLPQFLGNAQMSQPQSQPEFNPFSLYPNQKAILEIDNVRLDHMSRGWTCEECENKRRLVRFERRQEGGRIIANFEPVSVNAWVQSMICVSCIWWEGKDRYYITSVDTIALLEALVGARFTVEEKNRIRRNLEGFKPETISKAKSESEDFFKLIMQFGNPRPRNIEKDVKVFEWELLSKSLGKIISKYSASYSSTSGAISTTPSVSDFSTDPRSLSRPDSVLDLRPTSPGMPSYHSPLGYTTQQLPTSQLQNTTYQLPQQQQQQQQQQVHPSLAGPTNYYIAQPQYPMQNVQYAQALQPRYTMMGQQSLSPQGQLPYSYPAMPRVQQQQSQQQQQQQQLQQQVSSGDASMQQGYQQNPGEYQG